MGKNFFSIIIVILFGIVAGFSLLHEGLIPTHDAEYHIVRFFLFNEAFNDGNLYPRWAAHLNNGFGVPLFTFVYPLPNYIAVFSHSLGLSFIDSFRFEMFVAIIVGAIFFYLWAKEFWGRLGGIVSSVFYTFSPYHFVDIYIRGSIGEVWALAFFPAFLWAYTIFVKSNKKIFFILSALFLALIIFSHNILALMFLFFSLSYVAFLIYKEKNKKYLTLSSVYIILISLGLSSIFWLPAIYETKYVTGLQIFDATRHFPDLYQLLIPSWGSGFSGETVGGQMSFQIGVANLLAVFFGLFLILFRYSGLEGYRMVPVLSRISLYVWRFWSPHRQLAVRPQNDGNLDVIIFFIVWFSIIFFLMLDVSKSVWQIIPFMNYVQFPWRFLSLEILIASFLSGSIVYFSRSKIIAISLVIIAFFLGIGYARPAHYLERLDSYYLTRTNFIDGTNSPGNVFNTIFFKDIKEKEKEKIKFVQGIGDIKAEEIKTESYLFKISTKSPSRVQVNTAYFPGWLVFVNGKETKTDVTNDGLFSFHLPSGSHEVEVRLANTLIRNLAFLCFLISTSCLVTLFIKALFDKIKRVTPLRQRLQGVMPPKHSFGGRNYLRKESLSMSIVEEHNSEGA